MSSDYLDSSERKMLELHARRKIYETVQKSPGCHFREIERRSGLATGSARYHLVYLAKRGLINEVKDAGNIRYFPKSIVSGDKKLLGILRQKSMRDILLYILTHENCNHEHIVKAVPLSPSTVSWHVRKLQGQEIIACSKRGRKAFYTVRIDKDEIKNLLITYKESFFDSLVNNIVEMWETE